MKILLTVSLAIAIIGSCQCSSPFTITISTASEYNVGEDVTCKVTITNNHNKDYSLLKRRTPLEGLKSSIFLVTRNGKPLGYDGLLFKRGPPSQSEFILVPAKSSVTSIVDLSQVYYFSSGGDYTTQMETNFKYYYENITNLSTQHVLSNLKKFTLRRSRAEKEPKPTVAELLRRNSSESLQSPSKVESYITPAVGGRVTSSDVNIANTAYAAAYNVLYKSYQNVLGNPTLYKTWFGIAYNGYQDIVMGAYLDIKYAMETKRYTLYLHGPNCGPNVVAYTYHGSTTIYMCDGYFSAPATGKDSKAGTIIHEMSHAVALTEDFQYGQRDCMALAISNPSKAIRNADNYEYFSETFL